ncbi:transposase [Streptosporangium sp. NPDC000396]|uniref:transposase n=1 Tax=Streptosporangium sp. NPDC000396 TaxID=3366185 RepID=UPI0036874245
MPRRLKATAPCRGFDGIRWRTRTGAPWRDVPERYGKWETVYGLFRRWQRDGIWALIVTNLQTQATPRA